ncbi:outer membrane protein assembly factor BamE [Limnobacter sp.]|uniref:outer membrane protein assembly factor BamE n=1 Tax=Limnobacter sp. TaxID=2003368 RepID=UPI0035178E55
MRILRLNLMLCATLSVGLAACSTSPGLSTYVPSFVKPYRFDIQQGNFVTEQEVQRLRVGMTKDQVRFIMGTPLLNSPFHENRWDYLYRLQRANGEVVQSRYTVIFDNGLVARHGGENLPQNPTDLLGPAASTTVPKGPLPAERPAADIKESETVSGSERAPVLK